MDATLRNMRDHEGHPGMFAYSPSTGEECSADHRDYWHMGDDETLVDENGDPMALMVRSELITEL